MEDENSYINLYVASRIQTARRSQSLTAAQLAAIIGVAEQQIILCETGHSTIEIALLYQVAEATNRQIEWFFEEIPEISINNANNSRLFLPTTTLEM